MKKSKILVFGLLAALVLVGAGAGKGFAPPGPNHIGLIMPSHGSCCQDDSGSMCYASSFQECRECCTDFQNDDMVVCINDRWGCGCCYMPPVVPSCDLPI